MKPFKPSVWAGAAAAAACLLVSCSHSSGLYLLRDYDVHAPTTVKRITVGAWGDEHQAPGLAAVLAQVTTDYVKLRKNYLVHPHDTVAASWDSLCVEGLDGVLWVRALEVETRPPDVSLHASAELYACKTGALVWRIEGHRKQSSQNADLAQLVQSYAATTGQAAQVYAAPAFVLLQEMLGSLPDPVLNDHDIEEKIELGAM